MTDNCDDREDLLVCFPIDQLATDRSSNTNNALLRLTMLYTRRTSKYGSMSTALPMQADQG
jgi:hypothetical protein